MKEGSPISGMREVVATWRAARRLAKTGSPAAARALAHAVIMSGDKRVARIARRALAVLRDQDAIDEVCEIWSKRKIAEFDALTADYDWIATRPPQARARTALRAGRPELLADGDDVLARTLLVIADQDYDTVLRGRAEEALALLRDQDARELVCDWALEISEAALRVAVSAGFVPRDAGQHALLLFLAGEFDRYEELDFDGSLLRAAYDALFEWQRRRVSDVARRSGRLEWLHTAGVDRSADRIAALSDHEWETTLAVLTGTERWAEMWRLTTAASPARAAELLHALAAGRWRPEGEAELVEWAELVEHAMKCSGHPLTAELANPRDAVRRPVRAMVITPDGTLMAGGEDKRVAIYRLPSTTVANQYYSSSFYTGRWASRLALTPDGGRLVAACSDRVHVWDLGGETQDHSSLHKWRSRGCVGLAISPDGGSLMIAEGQSIDEIGLPDGRRIASVFVSGEFLADVAFAPAGDLFATASTDGPVRLWRFPDQEPLMVLDQNDDVRRLAITPDGRLLAGGDRAGEVRLWHLPSGQPAGVLESPRGAEITALAATADGELLAGGDRDGRVWLWHLSSGGPGFELGRHSGGVTALAPAPDGGYLASACEYGSIMVWLPRILRLVHLPVARIPLADVERLGAEAEGPWAGLVGGLVRRRHRYDIELGDAIASAYDVDIEVSE